MSLWRALRDDPQVRSTFKASVPLLVIAFAAYGYILATSKLNKNDDVQVVIGLVVLAAIVIVWLNVSLAIRALLRTFNLGLQRLATVLYSGFFLITFFIVVADTRWSRYDTLETRMGQIVLSALYLSCTRRSWVSPT